MTGTSTASVEMSSDIDESLYSRQLYVLGAEAMKQMAQSDILIVGMRGLGAEIAKDVCLAGVKSVTIWDREHVTVADLGTQFFLREADIGRRRDEATLDRLREVNRYVPVELLARERLEPDVLKRYKVVVLTDVLLAHQLEINDITHANNVHCVSASTHGLFGSIFCDFGPDFTVYDDNGEAAIEGMIGNISNGIIKTLEGARHNLQDGDFVKFAEVEGFEELNDGRPHRIRVIDPYRFALVDTHGANQHSYRSGGVFQQVKTPKQLQFKSLRQSLPDPVFCVSDFAKYDRTATLHVGFQAISLFRMHNDRLPRPRNDRDAEEIIRIARHLRSASAENVDEEILREMSYQAMGELAPMNSVIGAFAAQEVLKACSGKFTPLTQYLYFDSLESSPSKDGLSEQECAPKESRYDGQIAVFGKSFQRKIAENRQFLVGAGAIGCEMLKNWAGMGIGTAGEGCISLTDLDTIEKSNLNRQFLFGPEDLGKSKAEAAARAVADINSDLQGRVKAYQTAVGQASEGLFGDDFYDDIDCITNALDNIEARQYMDRRSVRYGKPLLESGTLGTKANVQVILPRITESYSSSSDAPEKELPLCLVKQFPHRIEHTIAWASDQFRTTFQHQAESVNACLAKSSTRNEATALLQASSNAEVGDLEKCVLERPSSFLDCIKWARDKFEQDYVTEIRSLLESFPVDSLTQEGTPFWASPKRAPTVPKFDANNPLHLSYVAAAANIRAFNYGITSVNDIDIIKQALLNMTGSADISAVRTDRTTDYDEMSLKTFMYPAFLEKDDDTNYHIDFITAASNLRALNYAITPADRLKTKQIAGKIIPAIATTTSLATGLVCLELYKILDGKKDIAAYKNSFVNLALPFFGFSEPIAAPKFKVGNKDWTLWDRVELDEDLELGEFIEWMKEEHKLQVSFVAYGSAMLYAEFMGHKDRLRLKLSALVEKITKKNIEPHVKVMSLILSAEDADGEEIESEIPMQVRIRG